LMLFSVNGYCIVDWIQGDGSDALPGATTAGADIDYGVTNYLQDPLDRLLINYIRGCTLTRTSATTVTVSAGEVVCSNGAGTIKRFRQNTATATMVMTTAGVGGIDSGSSEKVSTWYSLYAVADADATTFTIIASEQGVALSDVTYYAYIGSVYNDSASDLKLFYWFGTGQFVFAKWDIPINITTTLSSGAWSAATSLSSAIPSSSTLALLGIYWSYAGATSGVFVRPNGGTGQTVNTGGNGLVGYQTTAAEIICPTDSSQQIQYYNSAGMEGISINVDGFWITR